VLLVTVPLVTVLLVTVLLVVVLLVAMFVVVAPLVSMALTHLVVIPVTDRAQQSAMMGLVAHTMIAFLAAFLLTVAAALAGIAAVVN